MLQTSICFSSLLLSLHDVPVWQTAWLGRRRLTDHSCSRTVGSTDAVASLQLQEVNCCLITCLLPCTSSRLCNLRLNRADLAEMNHLSLMCVHYWWQRKKAEILTGCGTSLLSMALSASDGGIFSSRACKLENVTGLTYWGRVCIASSHFKM